MRAQSLALLLPLLALFAVACPASAEDEDPARRAAAQALFDQASALMDRHAYRVACPKLEEVARLQPGKVGTLLALGECYEGDGRLASAWTQYRLAASRARGLNDAREAKAQARAAALDPRLPRLRIRVDAASRGLPGLEVKRDGLVIGAVQWGDPLPVDPGEHVVEATAAGYRAFRLVAPVKEGETRDVALTLVPVASEALPVAGPPALLGPARARSAEDGGTEGRPSFFARHRASVLTGGAAVVLAGVAAGVGVATWQDYNHLAATCFRPCNSTGGVTSETTATNVLFGVAGAAALTSVGLFVLVERDTGSVSVGPAQAGGRAVVRF